MYSIERYLLDPKKAFSEDEQAYENRLSDVADSVVEGGNVKIVFISGASSAGKTPTTKKLFSEFAKRGVHAETISLDDFYKEPDRVPLDEHGKPDFETIYSLDLEYLNECLEGLTTGKEVLIPRFDFKKKARREEMVPLRLDEGELCIIEGLHALNPEICDKCIDKRLRFNIFLDTQTEMYQNPRFLRRMVRDYHNRATSAEQTFDMWRSVVNGEQKYVYPFKDNADAVINTFFNYEPYVLRDEAIKVLSEVGEDSPWFLKAREVIRWLEPLPSLPREAVPEDSLFREFIG